jgi:hypothetical protein
MESPPADHTAAGREGANHDQLDPASNAACGVSAETPHRSVRCNVDEGWCDAL